MCLAIPGKVLEIDPAAEPKMANVSFGGIQKRVCVEWVPDVKIGDYVLVHVGFALHTIDEQEALETLKILSEMGDLADELSTEDPGTGASQEPPETKKD
jgi:hydrogenase expression/formation protein HypC